MKNGFKIIDSHCHVYPDKIVDKAVCGTDNFYGVHSHCKGSIENLLQVGESAGVDRFIVQSVATTPKQVSSINAFIANEVSLYPNKLVGLGTLHQDSQTMQQDVENIVKLGLHGVKLHPDIQNFQIDLEKYYIMYDLCSYYKLPILMHTGDYRYDNSNPNRLKNVLKKFKDLTIIGAHFGGWSVYEQASKELSDFENLYVDCSSSFYWIKDKNLVKEIINRYTTDKVLFGSDYPMWSPKEELETFFSLDYANEDNEKMLSKNCEKVFKL